MQKTFRKLIALVLCFSLCLNLGITTIAANESNNKGVSFSVSLDKYSIPQSSEDQTVTMTVNMSQTANVIDMEYYVTWPGAFTTNNDKCIIPAGLSGVFNSANGVVMADNTSEVSINTIGSIIFTVPANTPAGTYTLGVQDIALSDNNGYWEEGASASTTLTITGSGSGTEPGPGSGSGSGTTPPVSGEYSAAISVSPAMVTVGDSVTATVDVAGEAFASAQATITYDSTKLQYSSIAGLGARGNVNTNTAGVLKIVDSGETKTSNEYKIHFTAVADGNATISLDSAAFSTKANAPSSDLIAATITTSTANVTVKKAPHTVTLPSEWFTGNSQVEDGADYTFTATKWATHDYGTITYTMGGGASQTVSPDADGKYTIPRVTGALVITMAEDPTPKQYTVTIEGDTAADDGDTATYNTDYHFTLPEDLAAGIEAGYTYELTSVTIGDAEYTGYSVEEKTYTIPGADITGNIEIVITKTTLEANQFTVTLNGNGAGDAAVAQSPVNKDADAVMTLTEDAAYMYEVTATMGDAAAEVAVSGTTYTVSAVTANVVFTVTKTLIVSSAYVAEYLALDDTAVWLVTIGDSKMTDKVYTYNGADMFWSEAYKAYCYLVISSTMPEASTNEFSIRTGTAADVNYGKDVNMTGKVDANDAQLVYNMYNAEYAGFSGDVTVEKFLRADVNTDGIINTEDAAAIVSFLLGA